jgi:glycosyltransferase involved in cell wall biosynthesis
MRPLPVMHLITELGVGGAQSALYRLLFAVDRQRYAPSVVCLYGGDGRTARRIRELGIPVHDLRLHAPWQFFAFWRLFRLLRRERPALLHCWLFHANILGRVFGFLAGVPVIVTGRRSIVIGKPWREHLNRITSWLDSGVIAVCERAREIEIERARVRPDKVFTIYNGVAPNPAALPRPDAWPAGAPGCARIVICVGRLVPKNGIPDLLDAWASVAVTHPEARLWIAGDGMQRGELERRASTMSPLVRPRFLGLRDDLDRLLPRCSLLVQPSWFEGLSNAILEAMAAGLPVVATAVGGSPELVQHGRTGLLVPPRDPGALAEAIATMLDNPERGREIGALGRQRVAEHFSIEQMVRSTEALYERLLERKQGRVRRWLR